jgi:L-alanine-DL-glutamate epimerase-like enolase superfamily enzyme
LGEIVFPPKVPIDIRRERISQLQDVLPSLIGNDYNSLMVLASDLRDQDWSWSGVSFCLETGFFDLKGQLNRLPCSDLFGGALNKSVEDYFSISERSRKAIRKRLTTAGPDRGVIKLKLGVGTPDDDVDHVATALNSMSEWQALLADANGGWGVEQACNIISLIDDKRVI